MNFLALLMLPLAIAQGTVDLTGFNSILFLFLGLAGIALAVGVSLIVIKVVLDLIGIDILGMVSTVFGRKKG